MPNSQQISDTVNIAANDTDQNILQTLGARIRTVDANFGACGLELLATGAAVGLEHAIYVNGENPVETSKVNAQNRIPQFPDDAVNSEPIMVMGGDQLQIQVTNTTGGALDYNFILKVVELVSQEELVSI